MSNYQTQYERDLKIKGFSERTVGTYLRHVDSYLSHFRDEIDPQSSTQVKDFLHYLMQEKKVSRSYMHQCYSALKYFYTTTLNEDWTMMKIPRAKRTKKLPEILSREEVSNLLNVTRNIKHKAILMITYSAGLRVSETASLKIRDIDSKSMAIKVCGGKGQKDRYTLLAATTLRFLRGYWQMYQPVSWLFEGRVSSHPLSTTTLQRVFMRAKEKAGITKKVSMHSLRHAFATHLLEQGVDVHVVQRLLGHRSIATTMVYLHLKKESLMKVVSPLDFSSDEEKS
jgi:site-specific recombinase XerD